MDKKISICVVGAGSSYTPELIEGILDNAHDQLPITSICLQDINKERMQVMAGLAERMIRYAKRDITVKYSACLEDMLEGVDYVISQIRVGGMEARFLDESIPLKYGIIGQETTGPGGMFNALRTIPRMIDIANKVESVAPDAYILNYTNPSGIITEAVTKHTKARIIGLCAGIPEIQENIKAKLSDYFPDITSRAVGLNHLGFVYKVFSQGKDITDQAMQKLADILSETGDPDAEAFNPDLIRLLNTVSISYLSYYFFRNKKYHFLKKQKKSRSRQIMEIEEQVFKEAAMPGTNTKPVALEKRGGGGYSRITFAVMKAIWNDSGCEITLNIPNNGAVEGIDHDAVVECSCRLGKHGPEILPVGKIPLAFRGIIMAVKAYESLTVEAAVKKQKKLVYQALLNHPLAGDLDVVRQMVDEMLTAHGLSYS